MDTLRETRLPLPHRREGKVRDIYDLPAAPIKAGGALEPRLLIVATDRISAFDVVMPTPIAGKGRLLTDVSSRWFRFIESMGLVRTHLITTDIAAAGLSEADAAPLAGRSMIVRKCRVVPVECVVRGYIDGSGWKDYQESGRICGVELPPGLLRGDRLPRPIFTPATKEAVGKHDENIDFERACEIAGGETMRKLRDLSVAIYSAAHEYAFDRGMILADTKFEFGYAQRDSAGRGEGGDAEKEPRLVDEALTPDSSRYWDREKWKPGGEQTSFDKQFLREYLNGLVAKGQWDKRAPGPELPQDVVRGTVERYVEVRKRLWG
ncbi:MAG TPA: phosphoribosylaminoimidazolesuccinocarboxamide synthase [Phycisphaerales bacterium]|nr:phosphoribosylaminoimidazolesuccinocarboxamide synthase [Phycisphaerales bacterium]